MIAVSCRSSSHSCSPFNSWRSRAGLSYNCRSVSTASNTIRRARRALTCRSRMASRPLIEKSPEIDGFRIDARVKEEELLAPLERRHVPSQAQHVLTYGGGAFLEEHQNARLAGPGAVQRALRGDEALAAPGTAAEQCHATGRQPSAQHIIQSDNAGRDLRELSSAPRWCCALIARARCAVAATLVSPWFQ